MSSKAATVRRWTSLADLRSMSQAAWDRGQLLREALDPMGIYPRRRSLKRPTASELRDDYAAARAWAEELFAGEGRYCLETADVGRTTIGSNRVPAAAIFRTVDDEIAFADKARDTARFLRLADRLENLNPALRDWALKRPLELLGLGDAALTAARVALWLRENPEPGIYVRQLSLPGVHTKFIESKRQIIDGMAAVLARVTDPEDEAQLATASESELETTEPVPESALPGSPTVRSPSARFASRHGFLHPPELIRFRLLDPELPVFESARDISVTAEAFATLRLPVHRVIVTENLINFLALSERTGTLALFGAGYGFSALREASWLQDCEVLYWGDLDTHGFRILDQLRSVHPHVRSILMDEATLLEHRDCWGKETTPSRARLTRLTAEEASVYQALRDDSYGPAVRLEQELIRWNWAIEQLLGN